MWINSSTQFDGLGSSVLELYGTLDLLYQVFIQQK
mgnify:CR=1 FL=1